MKRIAVTLWMMTACAVASAAPATAPSPDNKSLAPSTQPTEADRQATGRRTGRRNRRNNTNSAPAEMPASMGAAEPIPLSRDFEVLTRRSIFVKGRQTENNAARGDSEATPAEDVLVFNGVTVTDHETVAFIEDTSNGKVQVVRKGESIAQGKITRIMLDSMEYQPTDGHSVRISVGQNLRGKDAWNQTYGLSSGETSSESTTSDQPADAATASLIQRLKQKRMQELNGGSAPSATTAPSAAR